MADLNDPVPGTPVSYYSVIAALAGSMITLRFLVEASARGRAAAVGTSFVCALFVGPAISEWLELSPRREWAMMFCLAIASTNLLAGAWTFLDKFRTDPQAAVTWLRSILPWPIRSGS